LGGVGILPVGGFRVADGVFSRTISEFCQLVAFCAGWWIADLEFCTKIFWVMSPQIFCTGKDLWLCMANGFSHTNDPWARGKNATLVFAVEIFVQNRSVDT
jgi:hypothetical protein